LELAIAILPVFPSIDKLYIDPGHLAVAFFLPSKVQTFRLLAFFDSLPTVITLLFPMNLMMLTALVPRPW
jgi:hypothetical protein